MSQNHTNQTQSSTEEKNKPCCGNCQEFLGKPGEPTGLCQLPHVLAGVTMCTFMPPDSCCNDWKAVKPATWIVIGTPAPVSAESLLKHHQQQTRRAACPFSGSCTEECPTPEEMKETMEILARWGKDEPAKETPDKGITSDVALDKVRTLTALVELRDEFRKRRDASIVPAAEREAWAEAAISITETIKQVRDGDLDLKQPEPAKDESKMTTHEPDNTMVDHVNDIKTFTFTGPISWEWTAGTEEHPEFKITIESKTLPDVQYPGVWHDEIDELIARHQATLDLLAKPAQAPTIFPRIQVDPNVEGAADKFMAALKEMFEGKPAPQPARAPIQNINDLPKDHDVGFYNKPESKPAGVNKIRTREILKESPGCVKYTTYTWPKSAGDRIPEAIVAELAESIKDPLNDIEESLAAGPFCGAICSIDPRHTLVGISRCRFEDGPTPEEMNRRAAETRKDLIRKGLIPEPALGCRYPGEQHRCTALDYAFCKCHTCKPEPAPAVTGEVIGFVHGYKDGRCVKVRLDDGRIAMFRCQKGQPTPSKPALDREAILKDLDELEKEYRKRMGTNYGGKYAEFVGVIAGTKIQINQGVFDLPATDRPREEKREHKCRCSTANLVGQLRSRASVADGIDVTDLAADQGYTFRGSKPATVIVVMKEANQS